MNYFYLLILFTIFVNSHAQVGISKNNDFVPHTNSVLQVEGENKTVFIPQADNNTFFPNYNAAQPDKYNDDPTLKGAIIFNKADENIYHYDGTKWINSDPIITTLKTPQLAHFTRNGVVRSGNCSPCNTIIVPFVSNAARDFNNIAGLSLASNVFTFGTAGVYRISFKSPVSIARTIPEALIVYSAEIFSVLEIQKTGTSTWVEIDRSDFQEAGGAVGGFNLSGAVRAHISFSSAFNLSAGDKLRIRFGGVRTVIGVPIFNPAIDYIDLDSPTADAIGEVIIEKIEF